MRPVELQEVPALLPGHCYRCRSAAGPNRQYFIDTGIDIDMEGVLYLCNTCMFDIIKTCPDFYTQAEMNSVVDSNNFLLEDARKKIKKYDDTVDALKAVGVDPESLLSHAYARADEINKAKLYAKAKEDLDFYIAELEALQIRFAQVVRFESENEVLTSQVGELDRSIREKTYRVEELEATIKRMHEEGHKLPPVSEPVADSYADVMSEKSAKESLITTTSLFNYHIPSEVEGVENGIDGGNGDDDSQSKLDFDSESK